MAMTMSSTHPRERIPYGRVDATKWYEATESVTPLLFDSNRLVVCVSAFGFCVTFARIRRRVRLQSRTVLHALVRMVRAYVFSLWIRGLVAKADEQHCWMARERTRANMFHPRRRKKPMDGEKLKWITWRRVTRCVTRFWTTHLIDDFSALSMRELLPFCLLCLFADFDLRLGNCRIWN